MKRILVISPILVAAIWALSACTTPTPAPATAPTVAAPAVATSGAPAPEPTATPGVSAPPAAPQGTAESLGTPAPTRAINADLPALKPELLKSYEAHIDIKQESTGANATATPATPETAMVMLYDGNANPPVYSWTVSGQHTGQAGAAQEQKMVMVGQDMYLFMPDQGKWLKMPTGSPQNLPLKEDLLDPNRLAETAPSGLFSKANIVNAHEQLDGIDTTHYRANESQVQELLKDAGDQTHTPVSGQADFWVANDGGYLKQYVMTATLKDANGQQSTQTVKFSLQSENKPVSIATPAPDQVVTMEQLQSQMETAQPGGGATPAATP